MPGAVERWLETFMCKQYADLFEAYGFKTLFSVCQLQPSTLHSMGIAREHCDKILENVSVLRQSIVASSPEHINSRDTSFPPPSYSLRHGMHSPHYTGSMGPNYSDQMYDQHLVSSNQTNSYSYHSSPNYPSMSPSHQQYPGHGHGIHYNNHDGYGGGQPHYITSGQEIYGKQPYGAGSRIHSGTWDSGGGQGGGSAGAGHEALYNHSARGVLASPPSPPPPPSPATMAVPQAHYRHVLIGEQGGGPPHSHAWSQPHPSPMMPSPRATPSPGMTHGGPNRSPAHTKPYSPHPMPQHVQQHHHHVQQQQPSGYGYQPPGPAMSPPKPPNMNGQMGGAHIVPSQSSNPVPPSATAQSATDPLQSLQKMVLLEPQSRRPASRGGLAPSTPTPPVGGHATDGGGVVGGISGGTYIVGPGILKPSPGSTPHESCSPASSVISLASPQPLPQPSTPCRPPQAVSSSGVVSTTADRSLSQSPASRSPCRSAADDEDEEDDEDEDEKPVLTDLDARPQHIASSVPDTTSRVASQQQMHLQPGSPQRGGGGNSGNKRHSPRKRRLLDALDADGCGPPQSTVSTTVVGRAGPEMGSENGVLNCVVVNGPPKWRPRKMALAASASRDVYDAPPAPSVECYSPRLAPPAPDTTTSVAAPSSSPSSMSLSPSPARVITYRKKWQTQAAAEAARTAEVVDDGPVWQQHHHHQQPQPRRRHSSDDDQCTDGNVGVVNQEQSWTVPRVLPQGGSPYEPYPGEYMPHGCYGDRTLPADMHQGQPPPTLPAPLTPLQSTGATTSPTDGNTPKKKRGRPLGSKNKPKPFPPDGSGGEKPAAPKAKQGRKPKALQTTSPITPVPQQPLDGGRMLPLECSVAPTVTVAAPPSTEPAGMMECAPPKRTDSRPKGPFVKIEGPWDHPVSVDVVNTTLGSSGPKDEETDARGGTSRGLRKAKRHSGEILVSAKRRMSKIGFSSTLSANYDVLTKDHTWVCALCRMGSHHRGLGDLFGPYFLAGAPDTPPKHAEEVSLCPSTSAVKVAPLGDAVPGNEDGAASTSAEVANGQGAGAAAAGSGSCRKIRAKRKRSELVEEFFKSTLSKKGKKAKEAVPEEPVEEAVAAVSNPVAKQEIKGPVEHQSQKEVWVHEDCLVWSHGVYLIGQKICGLAEAVHDAGGNACSLCKENGATLGCLNKGCAEQYHYVCANEKGCQLNEENYSLLCLKHKKKQKRATVAGGTT